MNNFEAKKLIETLRSGVPSYNVGKYFNSSRVELMEEINNDLISVKNASLGRIISGKYGEGKSHALNTIHGLALEKNFVVSTVSISKENPFNYLDTIYYKLPANTFLPKSNQPGYIELLQTLTLNSSKAQKLLEFAKTLSTKKIYYVLLCYFNSKDEEQKEMLLNDLNGIYLNSSTVKSIYLSVFKEKLNVAIPFSANKDIDDYFVFLSYLFKTFYDGWVILFDEVELIGKFKKITRLNSYRKMAPFMLPSMYGRLQSTYSVFAFNSSFKEEVIISKHETENLEQTRLSKNHIPLVESVLINILVANDLKPLSDEEIKNTTMNLIKIHKLAYGWNNQLNIDKMLSYCNSKSSLLRTKIRTMIEMLDLIYQYGDYRGITIDNLKDLDYSEESEEESLEELLKY